MRFQRSLLFFLIIIVLAPVVLVIRGSFPGDALPQLVRDGNLKLVEQMVKRKADLEARTDYEQTALHCATRSDNAILVKYLLEKGADVNAVDEGGNTSVMCAVDFDRAVDVRVLEHLLEHEADVNARNKKGESAIYLVLLAQKNANYDYDVDAALTEKEIEENRVRPLKIRFLLECGVCLKEEEFNLLFPVDQGIVCNRRRKVEEFLEKIVGHGFSSDLNKEVLALLYGDRKYNNQLKRWCGSRLSKEEK